MTQDQSTFNWQEYLANNPDVAASTYGNQNGAWEHYINYGAKEGRQATFQDQIAAPQGNNQATFNWVDYLKNNPDVAGSTFGNKEGAWQHYSNYGAKEGRQANFDLLSKNTIPNADQLKTDPNTGLQYSTTPGHVGYVLETPVNPDNPDYGTTKQWIPSNFDFTGAKFDDKTNTYTMPSGEKIGYDFSTNNISSYATPYDKASPDSIRTGYNGQVYASTSGAKTANFQGLNLNPNIVDQGEYLVDPKTYQYYKDSSGNPIPVYHESTGGGFDDWIAENGWIVPLAMITAGAGSALAGGAAAATEGGLGAAAAEGSLGAGDVFAGLSANAPVDTALSQAAAAGAGSAGTGITGNAVVDAALSGAGKGALLGGGKAALTGQDPLTGALTGGLTGAVGGGLGNIGTQLTDSSIVGGALGGLGGGATSAAIGGRDPLTGALIGGLTGGTTAGINSLTDFSLGSLLSPIIGPTIANLITGGGSTPNLSSAGKSLISGLSSTGSNEIGTGTGTTATNTGALPVADTSIVDLKPGLVKGSEFKFASTPSFTSQPTVQQQQQQQQQLLPLDYSLIQNAATGGLIHGYAEGESVQTPSPFLKAQTLHGQTFRPLSRFTPAQFGGYRPREFAEGGAIPEGHDPTFFSEGGLNSLENTYVKGPGDGTSDSVAAMLANGEFVIPADVVSKLGNGSNDAGAGALSQMLVSIRKHAQQHDPKKLPPKSKNPLAYLLDAKRKVG